MESSKKPFVNTHTHIFTIKNVPPLLAKCFLPWPFYYLLHLRFVMVIFKAFLWLEKRVKRFNYSRTNLINTIRTNGIGRIFYYVFALGLVFNAGVFLLSAFNIEQKDTIVDKMLAFLNDSPFQYILVYNYHIGFLILIIGSIYLFYPEAWSLLFGLAKKVFSFLKFIPSNKSLAFIKRYFNF